MVFSEWQGKSLVIDHHRNVDSEMIEHDMDIEDIIHALQNGVEVKKPKKGIIERWHQVKNMIHIICVEECGDYWLVRHVGKIRITKKTRKILRGARK